MDTPVSGGVKGAICAGLTFMIGAKDQKQFEMTKEILGPMGSNFFNC